MFVYLLVLSTTMGIVLLGIHDKDEIHKLMAWLSGMLALFCIFILTPPLVKAALGAIFFIIGHKVFPLHNSLR